MQNDDVPKKGLRLDSPPGPPLRTLGPKATQGASQGASKRQSKVRQGASKRQSKAQPGPFLRKAQPSPVEGIVKGALQGGLYSRHCLQRREPDNVGESSEPDNGRNLLSH